jgi:hypothetical protein
MASMQIAVTRAGCPFRPQFKQMLWVWRRYTTILAIVTIIALISQTTLITLLVIMAHTRVSSCDFWTGILLLDSPYRPYSSCGFVPQYIQYLPMLNRRLLSVIALIDLIILIILVIVISFFNQLTLITLHVVFAHIVVCSCLFDPWSCLFDTCV